MTLPRSLLAGSTALLVIALGSCAPGESALNVPGESVSAMAVPEGAIPRFEVDPYWPQGWPEDWILGEVGGVWVDALDHVWIFHRPVLTLDDRETGLVQDPPLSVCCRPAPPVIELDAEANVVQGWGGVDDGYADWFPEEHGIYLDYQDNVWLSDHQYGIVQKYTRDGRHLLTLGEASRRESGNNDTSIFGQPTDMVVDPAADEVFISDGYTNRRVIVFDANTGAYKRHWGAYGQSPVDDEVELGQYDPNEPVSRHFRSPVHGIALSNDGLLYVADRRNDRVQVFQKDGTFVEEVIVAPWTLGTGSTYAVAFSPDPEQTFLYVSDGENNRIWFLRRDGLEIVGHVGRSGRMAGQFLSAHDLAVDSRGNIYVGETRGKRVQKLNFVGWSTP